MQAIYNKMENVTLLKVWSSDLERRNQLGDVQKIIILKRIVESITSNVFQYNNNKTQKK
jgi:hypothetical protein